MEQKVMSRLMNLAWCGNPLVKCPKCKNLYGKLGNDRASIKGHECNPRKEKK